MHDLPFIDAHAHFWDLARLRYGWLTPPFASDGPNGNVAAIARTYLPADYRAELAGWDLVGAVHVDAGAHADEALAETDWLEGLNARDKLPSAIVAFAALDHPDVGTLLAEQAARPHVRGIRHIVNWHANTDRTYTPRDLVGDEAWARGFALLGRHGLSFDFQAYPGQFARAAQLFARYPEVPVILNHAGMGVDGESEWRAAMRTLAALPHVAVKLSGLGFAIRPFDPAAAADRVRATIDLFGTARCMVASDLPTDRLFASAAATLGMLAEATAGYVEAERRALWAGNANRIYRIGLDV